MMRTRELFPTRLSPVVRRPSTKLYLLPAYPAYKAYFLSSFYIYVYVRKSLYWVPNYRSYHLSLMNILIGSTFRTVLRVVEFFLFNMTHRHRALLLHRALARENMLDAFMEEKRRFFVRKFPQQFHSYLVKERLFRHVRPLNLPMTKHAGRQMKARYAIVVKK